MPCYQDSHCQLCTLLGRLEHTDCKDLLWSQVGICKLPCDCLLCTQHLSYKDCHRHRGWHNLCSCRPDWRHTHHHLSSQLQWEQLKIFSQSALFEPKQNLIYLVLTYFVTANYTISCEALKADTAHGSSWCCWVNSALCIGNTRCNCGAGIYTSVPAAWLVTNLKSRAINIHSAVLLFNHRFWDWQTKHILLKILLTKLGYLGLTWLTASKIGISSVVWYASANASVILSLTNSIGSTSTRIYTFLIPTSQSCWAFRVCQAFIRPAFYIWASLVSWWTLASCPVNIHSANCLDATLLIWTRILTFSLNASLRQWTFVIAFTASYILKIDSF